MKASLKAHFEPERSSAIATLFLPAGDARIKASITEATFSKGPSLNSLLLSLEKPGSFIIDYNVPNQDFRFQFMNTVRLAEKPVSLTYTHMLGARQTAIDGSLQIDPANKLSVNYSFGSGNCKVKYAYAHGEFGRILVEPVYDLSKNTWDFAVSKKYDGGDSLKANYQTSSKVLGLEWNRDSKTNGCFKISAAFNLAEKNAIPKVFAESTLNYDF
ncbi:outer envelope pore protein 24, chloroplastic [Dendrobium catenatum]|uniref:Outer envelope pore protein 24, chloroplastic n=1 Tax=Dendrobium catenatum TaxID=906689 RepID=A0A2I0WLT9_9ASPA|nr:outer envelope pore protein 24, chloroplastic [Dendrobium catenatum]PKU76626.1 Outer envelope pore protein 24, chloroplastic [Dendrobium catenatum]